MTEDQAWSAIHEHYHNDKGVIRMNVNSKLSGHQESEAETAAIDWLCGEYDYECYDD